MENKSTIPTHILEKAKIPSEKLKRKAKKIHQYEQKLLDIVISLEEDTVLQFSKLKADYGFSEKEYRYVWKRIGLGETLINEKLKEQGVVFFKQNNLMFLWKQPTLKS